MNSIKLEEIAPINFIEINTETILSEVKDELKYSRMKILQLYNSESVKKAVDFIIAIHSEINLSPFIFVIVIELQKSNGDEDHALQISRINNLISKEIIVQVVEEARRTVFVREKQESEENIPSLIQIYFELCSGVSAVQLENNPDLLNICTLLNLLHNNVAGSCNGCITDSKVDTKKYFAGLTLLEIAVKNRNNLCLKFLKLFDWDLECENSFEIRPLEIATTSNNLSALKILLDVPLHLSEEPYIRYNINKSRKLLEIKNGNNCNILMIAAEKNRLEIVKFLLKFRPNLDIQVDLGGERVSDFAYKNKNYDVLCELLKFDSPFPNDFEEHSIEHKSLKEIISACDDFHEMIQDNDFNEMKIYIEGNPSLSFGYNAKNVSAVTVALRSKNFEIYSYLRTQGFSNGVDEQFNTCFEPQYIDQSGEAQIKDKNLNNFQTLLTKTVHDLLSRSKLGFNVENREQCFIKIKDFFETLLEIKELTSLVIIVSSLKSLQIIFDFNHQHIHDMDPTADKRTRGRTYHKEDIILIAAGSENWCKTGVLANLAHEFTHYALYKIYDNDCKPFRSDDEIRKQMFLAIQKQTADNKLFLSKEKTVWNVFAVKNYNDNKKTCELAVRVPEMYAKYHDNEGKLNEAKARFPELFTFYNEKMKPDFDEECEKLVKKSLIKLNDLVSLVPNDEEKYFNESLSENYLSHQKLLITCHLTHFSFLKVYQTFFESFPKSLKVFGRLESFVSDEYSTEIRRLVNRNEESHFIVVETDRDQNKEVPSNLMNIIRKLKNGTKLIVIIHNKSLRKLKETKLFTSQSVSTTLNCDSRTVNEKYLWSDMSGHYRKSLMSTKVIFQKSFIKFDEFFKNDSSNKNPIQTELFSFQNLKINGFKAEKLLFYVQRSFEINDGSGKFPIDEELILEKTSEIRIIADMAGMGKTTVVEYFHEKLIDKFPNFWVSLVHLKDEIENFTDLIFEKMNEDFLEFFISNFLNLRSTPEQLVCKSLYEQGKFILLLDGFDEISPVYKEKVLELIKLYKRVEENQLFVTSRMHLAADLTQLNSSPTFITMKPFSDKDQIDFMVSYWNSKSKREDFSELRILATIVQRNFLKSSLTGSLRDFIGVPLQTRMLAEIFEDSVSNELELSKAFSQKKNLNDFFGMFITKLLQKWMEKGKLMEIENVKNIAMSVDIIKIHISAAIEMNFDVRMCQQLQLPLMGIFPLEMLLRFGILQCNESKHLKFIHATFADYFITKFICQALLTDHPNDLKSSVIFEILLIVMTTNQHEVTRVFIEDRLEKAAESIDKLDLNSNEIFHDLLTKKGDFSVLHKPIMSNQRNIVRLIVKLLTSKENQSGLLKVLRDRNIENKSVFQVLFQCCNDEEFLQDILCRLITILGEENITKLFMEKVLNGHNALQISLENSKINSFEIALEMLTKLLRKCELQECLLEKDFEGNTLFHSILMNSINLGTFKAMWKSIAAVIHEVDLKKALKSKNRLEQNAFFVACENQEIEIIQFIFDGLATLFEKEEIIEMIASKDSENRNCVQKLVCRSCNNPALLSLFSKLRAYDQSIFEDMIFQNDSDQVNNHSVLNFLMIHADSTKTVYDFCEFLNGFLEINQLEKLLLGKTFISLYSNQAVCEAFFKVIRSKFEVDEVKRYLTKPAFKNENILHLLGIYNENASVLSTIINQAKEVINNDDEFKRFLRWNCQDNNTPLHAIVSCNKNPEVAAVYWEIVKQNFDINEQKEILKQIGFHGRSILHRSIENGVIGMTYTIFEIVKSVMNFTEIKDLFFDKHYAGQSFLVSSIRFNNPVWMNVLAECERFQMNPQDLINLFIEKFDNVSVIAFIALESNKDLIDQILSFLRTILDSEALRTIFLNVDDHGRNVLQYCKTLPVQKAFLNFMKLFLNPEEFINASASILCMESDGKVTLDNITNPDHSSDNLRKFWYSLVENDELQQTVFTVDSNGETLLHKIVKNSVNRKAFKTLWNILKNKITEEKQQELFLMRCSESFDCLALAVTNEHFNILAVLLKVEEILFDMRVKLVATYNNNFTLLHIVGKCKKNNEVISTLVEVLEKHLGLNEFKRFLSLTDNDENSAFNIFAKYSESTISFSRKLYKKIDKSSFKEIFSVKNKLGQNFFTCLGQSYYQQMRYFLTDLTDEFGAKFLLKLLMDDDNYGLNVVHYMISYYDSYLFEVLNFLKEHSEDFNSVLFSRNGESSILFYACKFAEELLLEKLLKFFLENVQKNAIQEFLLANLNAGRDIREYAVANTKDHAAYDKVEKFVNLIFSKGIIRSAKMTQKKRHTI